MTTSYFKKVPSKEFASPKVKSKTKEIEIKGLAILAKTGAVIEALKQVYAIQEAEIKQGSVINYFVNEGCKFGTRPANFKGRENDAHASFQLKQRSYASSLTKEQMDIFEKNSIPYKVDVKTPESFSLNTKYADDAIFMRDLEKLLRKNNMPSDLFEYHPEESKSIVTEDTIDAIFAKKDTNLAFELLPLATVLAMKPVLEVELTKADFTEMCELVS